MKDKNANDYFGWVLDNNPNFWEDNGFVKIQSIKHHYFGCNLAKVNHHPIYRKQLYLNYDYEEECAVEVFSCEIGCVQHTYILALYEWNNSGGTDFALKLVRQVSSVSQYNDIIREFGFDKMDHEQTFLLVQKMNYKEYEARRAEVYSQLAELKRQYINDNVEIEPGSFVMVNGMKGYLKDYEVKGGRIYPILFVVKHDGTPHSNKRIYVSSMTKMVKI